MKKILLLLVLVMMSGAVNAKTDKFACNQTLQTSYSWTGSNNEVKLFDNLSSVDKAKYKNLHVKISNKSNVKYVQVRIMCAGNYGTASWHKDFYTSTDIAIDFTEQTYKDENGDATDRILSDISRIYLKAYSNDASAEASYNINANDIYLETDPYEYMGITTTINSSSDKDTPFAWTATGTLSTINNNLGKTNSGTIFGYPNNNDLTHGAFDVTGYDKVRVTLGADVSDSYNKSIRLLKGDDGSNVEFSTTVGTTVYEKALSLTKCVSIKAGAGAGNCQNVSTVNFIKDFAATSNTAFNIAASTSSDVNYDRTFAKDRKSTVCLPFALTAEEVDAAGKFYELKDYDGATLTFKLVTTTEAYKPYLFEAKETGTPFSTLSDKAIVASSGAETSYTTDENSGYTATFNGVLAHQSVNGYYGWNSADGVFKKATSDKVTIDAFRAYITVSGTASARSLNAFFSDEETTGIQSVNTVQEKNNMIYNMAGQRVSANHKGLVIKGGKKVFLK